MTGVRVCVFGKGTVGGALGFRCIQPRGTHISVFFWLHWVFVAIHGLSCPLAYGVLVP